MDKLPNEILQQVFAHLNLHERIKCTLVCRDWWHVLDRHSLLYGVEIEYDRDMFSRLLEMIKQSPHRAIQVQELALVESFDDGFNKQQLVKIFPNVRVMTLIDRYSCFTEPLHFIHSKSKIEHLYDTGSCELAFVILKSNSCSQLKSLHLNFYKTVVDKVPDIIPRLKNLPVLKKLTLSRMAVGVNDLESIHRNIPTLKTFELNDVYPTTSIMPSNIISAASIQKFNVFIGGAFNLESHIQFYLYLNQKYINVPDIDYRDDIIGFYSSDEIQQLYSNGALDFLKLIGPKIKKLQFHSVPEGVDVFTVLDDGSAEIEELYINSCHDEDFFLNLGRSKKAKYVQKLDIVNSLIQSPISLKTMSALTTIELNFNAGNKPSINLTDYLNGFPPTLKKFLTTGAGSFKIDPTLTYPSSIEDLFIHCDLNRDFGVLLSVCFPNLVKLSLCGTVLEDVSITLSNPSLTRVDIYPGPKSNNVFSYNSTKETKPKYYLCSKYHKPTLTTIENMSHLHHLSIKSVAKLKLDTEHVITLCSQ